MTRFIVCVLTILLATPSSAALAQARGPLEAAVLSLARKDFVQREARPTTDGTLDWELIAAEVDLLKRYVPGWGQAMKLHSVDPGHPHSIAEHQLRALYHYARTAHFVGLRGDRARGFVSCLTVLTHDMGKLASPRDARGRQMKDPGHSLRSESWALANGQRLGLTRNETRWMAGMLVHHGDLGRLEHAEEEAGFATEKRQQNWRTELAAFLRTSGNLDFLEALTIADVRGINGANYDKWRYAELLPVAKRKVAAELRGK